MVISGIIRPPPDIRAVADRTALFVSKNGRAFEIKILNSEKGKTPKFAFLHGGSPFHAYYEDRIKFYDEGGTDEEEKMKEEEAKARRKAEEEEARDRERKEREEAEAAAARKEAARKKASAVDPVARALLAGRAKIEDAKRAASAASSKGDGDDADARGREGGGSSHAEGTTAAAPAAGPRPPPSLRHVSLVAPANLTPLQVEVIKLTAQYVALSERKDANGAAIDSSRGDNLLSNLTLREWSNPEFAFLQPRHSHFAYFTALVDGYRSFLPGGEEYERARNKARMDAKRARLAHLIPDDPKETKGKQATVVKKDIVHECLEAAAYRAEYQRDAAERRREASEGTDGVFGGAGTIDWHDFVVVETIDFDANEVVEALPPPTSLRLAALNKEQPGEKVAEKKEEEEEEPAEEGGEEMEESSSEDDDDADMEGGEDEDDEEAGEKLKVLSDYQPRVVSTQEIAGDASRTRIIDPITGKSVAISDTSEHMRIQLLDPKWADERRRFLEKQRETNFVAGDDIASNISKFAQERGDIFGKSESEVHDRKVDSERRLMEANRLIQEQAMQQPREQPQQQHVTTIAAAGVPPPPPPPTFAPPPPPPPPPQQMAQPSLHLEEPAAKRLKIEDPPAIAMAPPPPPGIPIAVPGMAPPGLAAPPPPPAPSMQNDQVTLSESDFIATLSNPDEIPICIRIPHDPSNSGWNFNGQTIDVTVKATSTIKELKGMLKNELGGMPANKMQLKHPLSGFMNKDGLSIAHYNVGPMTTLDLVPKTRGGRNK